MQLSDLGDAPQGDAGAGAELASPSSSMRDLAARTGSTDGGRDALFPGPPRSRGFGLTL